ncbi:SDR family NAD(P)-dependent oxidoreductase [Roseovarius aestuariivivens]|uniref:SDR family NAD(P)-dependent oxidoreductase n=1 Tax=Roseovarius aestuariivivens TaxID=1888910 RepID=UPI001AEBDD04|nr:SDR family NAD(P)-dependent oxidoreductase [Roseovarius aestuariivivens]
MTGRTALISGANRGIGEAIARRLHADGWNLSLGMRRPERPEWDTCGHCHLFQYDAEACSEEAWVKEAVEVFGQVDAIVPSAGIMTPGTIIEATDAQIDELMAINLKAPRRMAKAAWAELERSERGRIAILASLSGKRVKSAGSGLYSVSKFAVVALAHALRQAGWEQGIRATAICPGLVNTEMAHAISQLPHDEMSDPGAIADAVALILDMPDNSSVAEFHVNCMQEGVY